MGQSELTVCEFQFWAQHGDAGTASKHVGDLNAIGVA